MSRSIRSIPLALQAVWTATYAAALPVCIAHEKAIRPGLGLASPRERDAVDAMQWAENHAWEAVRRADGGEVTWEGAESVVCGPSEPTDDEIVEALAPIVAAIPWGGHWSRMTDDVRGRVISDCASALRDPTNHEVKPARRRATLVALVSWKAARSWVKK